VLVIFSIAEPTFYVIGENTEQKVAWPVTSKNKNVHSRRNP
jgi:hypothetical protein